MTLFCFLFFLNQELDHNRLQIGRMLSFASTDDRVALFFMGEKPKDFRLFIMNAQSGKGHFVDKKNVPLGIVHLASQENRLYLFWQKPFSGCQIFTTEHGVNFEQVKVPAFEKWGQRALIKCVTAMGENRFMISGKVASRDGKFKSAILDLKDQSFHEHQTISNPDYKALARARVGEVTLFLNGNVGSIDVVDDTNEPIKALLPPKERFEKVKAGWSFPYAYFLQYHGGSPPFQIEYSDLSKREETGHQSLKILVIDQEEISFSDRLLLYQGKFGRYWLTYPKQRIIYEGPKQ